MLYQWSKKLLLWSCPYVEGQVIYESTTAGTKVLELETTGVYKIECVGGGGAAAMKGVYDDKGYGWSGGSGGAFSGTFMLSRGTYTAVVGKANNNTTAQSGNSQTLNPTDTKTYGSSISGVVSVGGGGSGTTSGAGAAGAKPTFTIQPLTTALSTAGNAGASGSGGKGSAAAAVVNGGASVYNGYGKGQGCGTSEYAAKRYWINGTGGYIKVVYLRNAKHYNLTINPTPSEAVVTIDGVATNRKTVKEGTTVNYSVSLDGYVTKSGSVRVLEDTNVNVALVPLYTFTINPTPSNATVKINNQTTKSVTVASGTNISWSVSASGYTTQSGTLTLTANTTKNVKLVENKALYYCYTNPDYGGYFYAKVPLGSDTNVYLAGGSSVNQATKVSDLQVWINSKWKALSESSAEYEYLSYGFKFILTRYAAGDLYS